MNHIWVVECFEDGKWIPIEMHWTRKDAREEAKDCEICYDKRKYRVRKYVPASNQQ